MHRKTATTTARPLMKNAACSTLAELDDDAEAEAEADDIVEDVEDVWSAVDAAAVSSPTLGEVLVDPAVVVDAELEPAVAGAAVAGCDVVGEVVAGAVVVLEVLPASLVLLLTELEPVELEAVGATVPPTHIMASLSSVAALLHCCVPGHTSDEKFSTQSIQHVVPVVVVASQSQNFSHLVASSVESWLHVIWHEFVRSEADAVLLSVHVLREQLLSDAAKCRCGGHATAPNASWSSAS